MPLYLPLVDNYFSLASSIVSLYIYLIELAVGCARTYYIISHWIQIGDFDGSDISCIVIFLEMIAGEGSLITRLGILGYMGEGDLALLEEAELIEKLESSSFSCISYMWIGFKFSCL